MKPEPIYQQIGKNIRAVRRRAEKAQDDLATQLGISRATLANMETGRQRILVHQLYAIAQALNVSLGDLLPPPQDVAATANWTSLNFEGDLNPEQKKQVANLIGPIGTPANRPTEENNAKTATTDRAASDRIPRSKRTKTAR
jgi:transcriptional regulator with XRE-family HTH domain